MKIRGVVDASSGASATDDGSWLLSVVSAPGAIPRMRRSRVAREWILGDGSGPISSNPRLL
jgi:hypothetical protein